MIHANAYLDSLILTKSFLSFHLNTFGLAVILNILVIQSCELVEYHGGTLGLFKYGITEAGHSGAHSHNGNKVGCAEYSGDVEDVAIKYAQMWSFLAVGFGIALLLLMGLLQQKVYTFPFCSDLILLNVVGIGVQLSMAHVYIVWKNDVCETYGCDWGRGSFYNVGAQIMYLFASSIAFYHYYRQQQQQQHHEATHRIQPSLESKKLKEEDRETKMQEEPQQDKRGPPKLPELVDDKNIDQPVPNANANFQNNIRERKATVIVS